MKAAKQTNPANETARRGLFIQRKACCSAEQENTPFISPVRTGVIQTKLAIGEPGDQYEREADQMAERVMRMPMLGSSAPAISRMPSTRSRLQRLCADCEDEIQRKPANDLESEEEILSQGLPQSSEKIVQRQVAGTTTTPHASTDLSNRLQRRRGHGESLPPSIQAHMGNAFGTDFSAVRIHRDSEASQMSRKLNAQAFTHGSDIYFNQGKYDPASLQGRRLLGHELTHVVQQQNQDGISSSCVGDMLIQRLQEVGHIFGGYYEDSTFFETIAIPIRARQRDEWRTFLENDADRYNGGIELTAFMLLAIVHNARARRGSSREARNSARAETIGRVHRPAVLGRITVAPNLHPVRRTRLRRLSWEQITGIVTVDQAIELMIALLSTPDIDLPNIPIEESGGGRMAAIMSRFIQRFNQPALQTVTRRDTLPGYENLSQRWASRIRGLIDQSEGLRDSEGANNPALRLIATTLAEAFSAATIATEMRSHSVSAPTSGQFALIYNAAFVIGAALAELSSREERDEQILEQIFSIALAFTVARLFPGATGLSSVFLTQARTLGAATFNNLFDLDATSQQVNQIIDNFNDYVEYLDGHYNGMSPVGEAAANHSGIASIDPGFFLDIKGEFNRGFSNARL